jgi:hypothetical protein
MGVSFLQDGSAPCMHSYVAGISMDSSALACGVGPCAVLDVSCSLAGCQHIRRPAPVPLLAGRAEVEMLSQPFCVEPAGRCCTASTPAIPSTKLGLMTPCTLLSLPPSLPCLSAGHCTWLLCCHSIIYWLPICAHHKHQTLPHDPPARCLSTALFGLSCRFLRMPAGLPTHPPAATVVSPSQSPSPAS